MKSTFVTGGLAISYNKRWKLLADRKLSKADLRKAAGIAPNTKICSRRAKEAANNNADKACSPTTMYNDYSINESPFHWQRQNTTAENRLPASVTSTIESVAARCCLLISSSPTE